MNDSVMPALRLSIFELWKRELTRLLAYYERRRPEIPHFFVKLFGFFVALNFVCYWFATATAFPFYLLGGGFIHYLKISVPVGILGALFDSLSFFITVWIVRRAIRAKTFSQYLSHLGIDVILAIAATWWVLFVFVISGWFINLLDGRSYSVDDGGSVRFDATLGATQAAGENYALRSQLYQQRVIDALEHPARNLQNIYFGIVMGMSAMLPTCIHLYLLMRSTLAYLRPRREASIS